MTKSRKQVNKSGCQVCGSPGKECTFAVCCSCWHNIPCRG